MKKIFTLIACSLLTLSLSAQVKESGFESTEGYSAPGTSVTGQVKWLDKITTDTFWDLLFSNGSTKDYSCNVVADAKTGTQALQMAITTTSGSCKLRSNAQSTLTAGDVFKVSYWAKTDAAGVALGGEFISGIDGNWNKLTTEYQQFTEFMPLPGTNRFFIYLRNVDEVGGAFNVWVDDIKIELAPAPDTNLPLPISYGFESTNGYASHFLVEKQLAWSSANPSSIWKDVFSSAEAANKAYASSIESDFRPGSAGVQCMKFELNNEAFIPSTEGDLPTVKLRSLELANIMEGNNYVIRLWAKTTNASGEAAISAVNSDFQTITNTWTEYELPYMGLSSKLAQLFFKEIGKDYDVLIDDISIEVNTTTAINESKANLAFAIYPNPAASKLFIQSEEIIEAIEIYSIAGQKVLETTHVAAGIDISHLANGLYIVSANINGKPIQHKFTKQ